MPPTTSPFPARTLLVAGALVGAAAAYPLVASADDRVAAATGTDATTVTTTTVTTTTVTITTVPPTTTPTSTTTTAEPPTPEGYRRVAASTAADEAAGDLATAGISLRATGGSVAGVAGPVDGDGGPPYGTGSLRMTTQQNGLLRLGIDNGFAGARVSWFLADSCESLRRLAVDASAPCAPPPALTYGAFAFSPPVAAQAPALPQLVLRVDVPERPIDFRAATTTTEYWVYDPLTDDGGDDSADDALMTGTDEWHTFDTREQVSDGEAVGGHWTRYDADGQPIGWTTGSDPQGWDLEDIRQGTGGRYANATFGEFEAGASVLVVVGDAGAAIRNQPGTGTSPAADVAFDGLSSAISPPLLPPSAFARSRASSVDGTARPFVLDLEPRAATSTAPGRTPSQPGRTPTQTSGTPPLTTAGTPGRPTTAAKKKRKKAKVQTCRSRRSFTIRLRRTAGGALTRTSATVNGRQAEVRRRADGRYVVLVSVKGREGRSRFVVRLRATTADGRELRATRTYRPCRPKPLGPINGSSALRLDTRG